MQKYTILLIEDDLDIRTGVGHLLENTGFEVLTAPNGRIGLELFSPKISLIILDVMMPGISGYEVCEIIRKQSVVPILFLTAKTGEMDRMNGFIKGGDDYICKPFSYTDLLIRIKALLRRTNEYNTSLKTTEKDLHKFRSLVVNRHYNDVSKEGTRLILTNTEYKILLLMLENPEKIFTLQELYEAVWGEQFLETSSNTIMVHIKKLRNKIEQNPKRPEIIITVWGKGYSLGKA